MTDSGEQPAWKQLVEQLLPPFVYSAGATLKQAMHRAPVWRTEGTARRGPRLFNGSDALFKRLVHAAHRYAEYGVGESTAYVLRATNVERVVCIDTSRHWLDRIARQFPHNARLCAVHVELGPLGAFGRPASFRHHRDFMRYVEAPFTHGPPPDVVLVDGRFRVACLLHCLLNGPPGLKVLFDDYRPRPHYHVVEDVVRPVETCGRQALFVQEAGFDRAHAEWLRDRFLFVTD